MQICRYDSRHWPQPEGAAWKSTETKLEVRNFFESDRHRFRIESNRKHSNPISDSGGNLNELSSNDDDDGGYNSILIEQSANFLGKCSSTFTFHLHLIPSHHPSVDLASSP